MKSPKSVVFPVATAFCLLLSLPDLSSRVAEAQEPVTISDEGVIAGTMQIDFKTRTTPDRTGSYVEGSPALGAQDKYSFSLVVAKTTQFSGNIARQPNIYSKTLKVQKQKASLGFDINVAVLNPKDTRQQKTVGKWVGVVPIHTQLGVYDLSGGRDEERPLRMAIDTVGTAKGFTDQFAGRLVGKAEKKENLAAYTYKRIIGGKIVAVTVKKSDPMRFENLVLAKGPAEVYTRVVVNGRLDYDYETGNWFTDGIRLRYNLNGTDFEDVVTGSIKWVEDPDRASNGKGQYEFNLRFNEEKNKPSATESNAFEKLSAEEAFFAVDNSIPCLTGTIQYVDSMVSGGELPASSTLTFNLNSNKLTKQQVMSFFKLWMVCVGPTNDE